MEDILNKIYSYEYFGFYLILAIIVLVILFLIILFFGKKDQKNREIEATKKLQQISEDTFKEEDTSKELEINDSIKERVLEDTIIVPNIEDVPTLNYIEDNEEIPEPVLPIEEVNNVIEDTTIMEPLLEKVEEKPLVFENTNVFNNEFVNEVKIEEVQNVKEEVVNEEIEVPKFNFEEIIKDVEETKTTNTFKSEPVFSSVYVKPKEEVKEEKVEIPVEKALEDLAFELPSLKKEEQKEEEIEVPILKDYNLDELSGETYTINK